MLYLDVRDQLLLLVQNEVLLNRTLCILSVNRARKQRDNHGYFFQEVESHSRTDRVVTYEVIFTIEAQVQT